MVSASATGTVNAAASQQPLSPEELRKVHAYWRAANYLSVGQIYLYANPLLREPLELKHIKPRLLGHWGTTPGLNFIYVHLNRLIKQHDLDVVYVAGPGHGGPGLVANAYLEGTYSEIYPGIAQTEEGLRKLFKQFSFPGGIPSHVAPETPGRFMKAGSWVIPWRTPMARRSIIPDLLVCCVVGDGEAETGPLATSWHSNKFLNPARDGAVLPILHLNGYKIANPTVLGAPGRRELKQLFSGYGYKPYFVEGHEPETMHQLMAATLDAVLQDIRDIQEKAPQRKIRWKCRCWPMIVLAHSQGLDRPESCGWQAGGRYLARAPGAHYRLRRIPEHVKILDEWMKSYKPEELFDERAS